MVFLVWGGSSELQFKYENCCFRMVVSFRYKSGVSVLKDGVHHGGLENIRSHMSVGCRLLA